jgi:serine/threonine protein kinase/tetratricopeptide (TPR) repeat protein
MIREGRAMTVASRITGMRPRSMSTTDRDRNHLFSVLALQMDFVSREALRRAVETWDADPSRSIASILLELGSLAPSRASLLETLVEEHIQVHGVDSLLSASTVTGADDSTSLLASLAPLLRDAIEPEATIADEPDDPVATIVDSNLASPAPPASAATGLGYLPTQADPDDAFATQFDVKTLAGASESYPDADRRAGALSGLSHHGTSATPASTSHPIRYTILKHYAKGGLGDVYIARDEELNREVALKEIQEKHADRSDSRLRFLIEAEVTGGLEHPGIVPVYGLGRYPDGRPFYAMKFIRGDTLRDAIERFHNADENPDRDPGERTLALRSLLGCFIDVCNAIGYAHSRGVLHRDIKPGNVMLGKFGETLVVDWGLAKTLDHPEVLSDPGEGPLHPASASGSTPTMMGSAVGTPQFMSPEQAAGKLDELGPAADIYSLGATLYPILTGRTAFTDPSAQLVLHKVQRGDFPTPRTVNPRVPAALEAICLKAMALKPEDRYKTTRELASDVDHWLADEPVSVYREPFSKRLARWARRHRQAVIGGAAVVLTVLVALTVSNVLIGRERDRTLIAKRESDIHYRLGRNTVEAMLDEAAAIDLADVPLMENVRRRMLTSALGFYNDFLQTRSNDPELLLDILRAYARLGDIHESLGDAKASEDSYKSALANFEALPAPLQSQIDFRRTLAKAEFGYGILLKKANRFRESDTMFRRSLAKRTSVASESKTLVDQRESALTLYHLGALLARQKGRTPEDEKIYQDALEQQQSLLLNLRESDGDDVRRDIARNLNNLGILLKGSDLGAALARFRDAYDMQLALEKSSPESASHHWQAARYATNIGGLYMLMGQNQTVKAHEMLEEARKRFKKLVGDFPRIPDYRQELAAVEDNLAMLMLEDFYLIEDSTDPVKVTQREDLFVKLSELLDSAVDVREGLVKDYPTRPDYVQSLSIALRHQAEVFKKDADRKRSDRDHSAHLVEEARARINRSIALQSDLLKRYPDARDYDVELARSYYVAGFIARVAGRLEESAEKFQQSVALTRPLLADNPKSKGLRRDLGDRYQALAAALLDLGRVADALKNVDLYAETLAGDPEALRRAASAYARALAKPTDDKSITAEELARTKEQRSIRCVELLRAAYMAGLGDPRELSKPVYTPLAGREDFERLKQEVETKAKSSVG